MCVVSVYVMYSIIFMSYKFEYPVLVDNLVEPNDL